MLTRDETALLNYLRDHGVGLVFFLGITMAGDKVVIHHARGLHECIANS